VKRMPSPAGSVIGGEVTTGLAVVGFAILIRTCRHSSPVTRPFSRSWAVVPTAFP
jgi:hypothetical protein